MLTQLIRVEVSAEFMILKAKNQVQLRYWCGYAAV